MIKVIKDKLKDIDPLSFSLILSVFFIFIHFQNILSKNPIIYIPFIILAAAGILFQETRKSKWYWLSLSGLYLIWVILNWQNIDNHMYLWGYWILSIAISKFSSTPEKTLQYSAKFLIVFCMGFAVIQKLNPIFTSGDFFYYTLITDSRFFFIGPLINYNMIELIRENNGLLQELMSNTKSIILNPGPYILHPISQFLTWYVIILEFLISIIFLLPKKYFYKWQHWLLFLFFTVYILLPIRGFAFTLIAMGVCLINKNDDQLKALYILFILYMFAFSDFIVNYFFNITYSIF